MRRHPLELISALGLPGDAPAGISAARIEEFANRRRSFDWTHLGASDLPVGTLLDLLKDDDRLCPPRSGHLGNWSDIALGRAGAMDFNQAICIQDLGYPLIYCFNQTEDRSLECGDWVYLPGSLIEQGRRQLLPLLTWDGGRFVHRDRSQPLFVPLVLTEYDGERLPLVQLHWRRMRDIGGFRFQLEAKVIHDHRDEVRPMLAALLDEANRRENPRRAFQDLISHAVSLDGRMVRTDLRRDGSGYWLEDVYFRSTDELVDAALELFGAVAEPERVFADMGGLPARLPMMAGLLAGIFSAIFSTHYPGVAIDRAGMTQPFNPHCHWGARDMAGYPPKRRGYFAERSTTRSIRQICDTLVARFPQVDPVYFILMPASLFMLCPSDAHPRDSEHFATLFRRVRGATDDMDADDDRMMDEIERQARTWLETAKASLSTYILNRFSPRQGVLHDAERPSTSRPREPEGFRDLSLRQACMIVGALVEAVGAQAREEIAAHEH